MAFSINQTFRSIWHAMTTQDRHSTPDSPHRSGRHVPLSNGRNGMLTSVATASESQYNVSSPYQDDNGQPGPSRENSMYQQQGPGTSSPRNPSSPGPGTYSPGARTRLARRESGHDGFDMQSPGDVPMQSFQDGMPPAPPVSHSWKKIDSWADDNYPELFDQLCEGATNNDLNELEHQLDCSLPQDVRDSIMIHDGQERLGMPTGIIFSAMLMDCEEMVQEWETWRKVNEQFLDTAVVKPAVPTKALGGSNQASSSSDAPPPAPSGPNNSNWRQDFLNRQQSVPPNSVQKAYAHPGWIPLVRDWGGNNLAVDLAPGPGGRWGQIILFGRDFDTKYVVARSWAHFLGMVADDLNSGKWYVDEDTNELKLREFKETRVEPSYFNILRWRMDQKYGRRAAAVNKRRSAGPPPRNASPAGSGPTSPYAGSPTEAEPRGRTLQRPNGPSPVASPNRPVMPKPSPLARVTEETALPELENELPQTPNGKLVEVETPRPSDEHVKQQSGPSRKSNEYKGKENAAPAARMSMSKKPDETEGQMKEIEI